ACVSRPPRSAYGAGRRESSPRCSTRTTCRAPPRDRTRPPAAPASPRSPALAAPAAPSAAGPPRAPLPGKRVALHGPGGARYLVPRRDGVDEGRCDRAERRERCTSAGCILNAGVGSAWRVWAPLLALLAVLA